MQMLFMSNPLKTGGLLTTACLAWAALDAALPCQAHAEPIDADAISSGPQPVTPSPMAQTLVPVPASLPFPRVPAREEASFRAVDQIVPDVTLPNTWPVDIPPAAAAEPALESAIAIEVEPFSEANRGLVAPFPGASSVDQAAELPAAEPTAVTPLPRPQVEEIATAARSVEPPSETQKSDLLALAVEPDTAPEPRGWFDRQMAETLARRQVQREAQLRENLITSVRQHLKQNNIAAAQQIAQNPVFLDAERTALQQAIATVPATMNPPDKIEPTTQLAKDVARLAARQTWLLDRLPATAAAPRCNSQSQALPIDAPLASGQGATSCTLPQPTSSYAWLVEAVNQAPSAGRASAGMLPLATAAPVTSRYGWRTHPIYGDRRFHAGVDFGAPLGTPVRASLAGYVETSEYLDGYGYTVILENASSQERHLYAHLADMAVHGGQWVNQGDIIGWVGNTGNSTGPHLHFEIHRLAQTGWITVDPLPVALQ